MIKSYFKIFTAYWQFLESDSSTLNYGSLYHKLTLGENMIKGYFWKTMMYNKSGCRSLLLA